MSSESLILLIAACCGVFGLVAWVGLMAVPAWQSYGRLWERMAAIFLTVYSLAAFMIVGAGLGLAVIWFWDRFAA